MLIIQSECHRTKNNVRALQNDVVVRINLSYLLRIDQYTSMSEFWRPR